MTLRVMKCPAGHEGEFQMAENPLVIQSKGFAVEIIRLCEALWERRRATAIINQLLRSGTSIGANIHEGNYASSRADFIFKFQLALKECYETEYWLEVFHDAEIITGEEFDRLHAQCGKIRKILIASINTAKKAAE